MSDSEGYSGIPDDLSNLRSRRTVDLNISSPYVSSWTRLEAFREFYQNWRDGIIDTLEDGIDLEIAPYEDNQEISFYALHPVTKKFLGYILFKYTRKADNNERCGTLELTNFNAELSRSNFTFGGTSKQSKLNQAGHHGEGFKVASLVMAKHAHWCRIVTSGVNCLIKFNKRYELACTFSAMTAAKIKEEKKKIKTARGARADPCNDVSVYLGESGKSVYTPERGKGKGEQIPLNEFRQWITMALHLHRPQKMVKTPDGAVILDPSFKGNIYIMGLRVREPKHTDLANNTTRPTNQSYREYKYGYDFSGCYIGRDRVMQMSDKQQALMIHGIWSYAIMRDDERSQGLLETYTNHLMKDFNVFQDFTIPDHRKYPDSRAIERVWERMRARDPKAFYYDATRRNNQTISIIENNLKRQPQPLKHEFWELLVYALGEHAPRTPEEEEHHLFEHSMLVTAPQSNYVKDLLWALQCCIKAYSGAGTMDIDFVDGEDLMINVVRLESDWLVHSKWLTKEGAHQDNMYCPFESSEEADGIPCYHTVHELWEDMVPQLREGNDMMQSTKMENKIKYLINNTPRGIVCSTTPLTKELLVSWKFTGQETDRLRVVLHTGECLGAGNHSNPGPDEGEGEHPALFLGVNANSIHRSSIASGDYKDAFIALPPPARKPRHRSIHVSEDLGVLRRESVTLPPEKEPSHPPGDVDAAEAMPDTDTSPELGPVSPSEILMESDSESDASSVMESIHSVRSPRENTTVEQSRRDESCQNFRSFRLGEKIDFQALWDGRFPQSHQFYRAADVLNENAYIAIPKSAKRQDDHETSGRAPKRLRRV